MLAGGASLYAQFTLRQKPGILGSNLCLVPITFFSNFLFEYDSQKERD